jgi:hypothetical protein
MKNTITSSIVLNVALFALSFTLYTLTAFGMGLGSNGEYNVLIGWTLFFTFIFLHLMTFTLIARKKLSLRSTYYLVGMAVSIVLYLCVIFYYSTGQWNRTRIFEDFPRVDNKSMKKKTLTRILFLIIILIPLFYVIRYITLYILIFSIYGESAQGSIAADEAYNLGFVRHLPIILPVALLLYQSVKKRNKEDFITVKSNLIVIVVSSIIYALLEGFEILWWKYFT